MQLFYERSLSHSMEPDERKVSTMVENGAAKFFVKVFVTNQTLAFDNVADFKNIVFAHNQKSSPTSRLSHMCNSSISIL